MCRGTGNAWGHQNSITGIYTRLLRPSFKIFPFCISWLCRFLHISVETLPLIKNGPVFPKGDNLGFQGSLSGSVTYMPHLTPRTYIFHTHKKRCYEPVVAGLSSLLPPSTHTSSAKQWAAVKIHNALIMVPPQICFPLLWMLTCHGNSPALAYLPAVIFLPVSRKDS